MFPAFNSTISSNPMANMSTGLLLRSAFKYWKSLLLVTINSGTKTSYFYSNVHGLIKKESFQLKKREKRGQTTNVTLEFMNTSYAWCIQKPVSEGLIFKGDTSELLPPIDIPRPNADSNFLRFCILIKVFTHTLQHFYRCCKNM